MLPPLSCFMPSHFTIECDQATCDYVCAYDITLDWIRHKFLKLNALHKIRS